MAQIYLQSAVKLSTREHAVHFTLTLPRPQEPSLSTRSHETATSPQPLVLDYHAALTSANYFSLRSRSRHSLSFSSPCSLHSYPPNSNSSIHSSAASNSNNKAVEVVNLRTSPVTRLGIRKRGKAVCRALDISWSKQNTKATITDTCG